MKTLLLILFLMSPIIVHAYPTDENYDKYFKGTKGCFLLYNMKTGLVEKEIGGANCREQVVACSTFKVPLSVMAFDAGILKDEEQVLKWDGKVDERPEVNADQNAKNWMKNSVVWFSQRLTPELGEEKIKKYLSDFKYGNEDMAGGLTQSWLVDPSSDGPALKISPYEQMEFMKNLWSDKLPVSQRVMQITRDLTYLETSGNGVKLNGKTGSNFYHGDRQRRLGWFIAHIEDGDQEYITVTNFSDIDPAQGASYGGARAKEITKEILVDEGLWQ